MAKEAEVYWLDPIILAFSPETSSAKKIAKLLRVQLREAIINQGYDVAKMKRCVYVIRITGSVIIAYPKINSPVLYIGRGTAFGRLASHISNWLHEAYLFGNKVGIELRICIPRRNKRLNFFKNVEADLIRDFRERFGSIPFFNSRNETKWEDKVRYLKTTRRLFSQTLGVGSGNRPQWAIRPTSANANHEVFNKDGLK